MLVDLLDNGNRVGGQPEALYLYGLGGTDGLSLANGSELVCGRPQCLAWMSSKWVHLNDLFAAGVTQVQFASGTLAVSKPLAIGWQGSTGGTDKWSATANWYGAPGGQPATAIRRMAGGRTKNTNDFAAGSQFNGFDFTSNAPAYELRGNPIKLAGDVTNETASRQTIDMDLQLVAGGGLFDTGDEGIVVAGSVSGKGCR